MKSNGMVALLIGMLVIARASAADVSRTPPSVDALRRGGFVVLMRHASSPREAPAAGTANADNTTGERQLDETGRSTATAFGEAVRRLKIPFGEVLSSPTYRARETLRLAGFTQPRLEDRLGDHGQSMAPLGEAEYAWLRSQVAAPVPKGTNRLIITHYPNIAGAYPQFTQGLEDGEALIFRSGEATPVARVRIGEWMGLSAAH